MIPATDTENESMFLMICLNELLLQLVNWSIAPELYVTHQIESAGGNLQLENF